MSIRPSLPKYRLKRSVLFTPLKREAIEDSSLIPSTRLMLQNGVVSKSAAGIFSLLPFGLRSLQKICNIVDEEMFKIGGQKISMPSLIAAHLWKETGRWNQYGQELIRLKDRKDAEFCLGPTHEEVVTDLVRMNVSSFRQLPLRLYQSTWKFRDEVRPRFGLLRAREFLMKDMYSFDTTKELAFKTYQEVKEAYISVFTRLGVDFAIADADTGNIGGNKSHEFHILSHAGEDFILTCPSCKYTSNVEKTVGTVNYDTKTQELSQLLESIKVSGHISKEQFLQLSKHAGLDLISVTTNRGQTVFGGVIAHSQSRLPNTFKVKSQLNADDVQILNHQSQLEAILEKNSGEPFIVFVDESLDVKEEDTADHTQKVEAEQLVKNLPSKLQINIGDFRQAKPGDGCPSCSGTLTEKRGIEVGHIFYLGTKYSSAMNVTYQAHDSQKKLMEMGCYGLGLTRILAAIIENSHDQYGIVWPTVIAPYQAIIVPTSVKEDLQTKATALYDYLEENGFRGELVLEDRDESPGFKMNDARTVGFPFCIVVGKASQDPANPKYEVQVRKTGEKLFFSNQELLQYLKQHTPQPNQF